MTSRSEEAVPGIVERLRKAETFCGPVSDVSHLFTEAADHIERLEAKRDSLFAAIEHGDDEHRAWLKEAIDAHFDGKPVPECRGSGRKDQHIERLTSALEPFAEQAEAWDPEQNGGCEFHDEDRISWDEQLTVGDLRRAREALSLIKKQGNGHG